MIEQDPRITEGPTFFSSLYAWMKRVALSVNSNTTDIAGKVSRSGDTMTGGLTLVAPALAPTEGVGENSTRIATTAWVRAALGTIFTALGFSLFTSALTGALKLPSILGGVVIQWGRVAPTFDAFGSVSVSFPIAYPNGVHNILVFPASSFVSNRTVTMWTDLTGTPTNTAFTVYARYQDGAGAVTPLTGTAAQVHFVSFGF